MFHLWSDRDCNLRSKAVNPFNGPSSGTHLLIESVVVSKTPMEPIAMLEVAIVLLLGSNVVEAGSGITASKEYCTTKANGHALLIYLT